MFLYSGLKGGCIRRYSLPKANHFFTSELTVLFLLSVVLPLSKMQIISTNSRDNPFGPSSLTDRFFLDVNRIILNLPLSHNTYYKRIHISSGPSFYLCCFGP